jgi:hypothetical protein
MSFSYKNLDYLNKDQLQILDNLVEYCGGQEQLNLFLSTPNKLFNMRPPLEMLLTKNYDFFNQFVKQ